ncbi:MAG: PP2C family protein-serine/threonine phosphatase [Rhodothermales bacterium]|nr:PP2C family protein-serine/threonine phosphatase [Rhodothermales bacterium]
MDDSLLQRFREGLERHRAALVTWLGNGGAHPEAPPEERVPVLAEIDAALCCIDAGAFGQCTACTGEVEPERLALDFTTSVCLDHYTEAEKRALERDLELAAGVQRHLFPCCVPALPGFDVAAHAKPAHIVGGDYYDFYPSLDCHQGFAIADVMGKGLPASMLMANLQASLRILGPDYREPHALAERLNGLFRYNLKLIRFISLCLVTLDAEAGRLRYCNAGHNPPLRWNAASHTAEWLGPTGPALGLVPEPAYTSRSVPFEPGDVVVLYTDGLVEARNPAGGEFGAERVAAYVEQHAGDPAEALRAGLWAYARAFSGGHLGDDVAAMVIRRMPEGV